MDSNSFWTDLHQTAPKSSHFTRFRRFAISRSPVRVRPPAPRKTSEIARFQTFFACKGCKNSFSETRNTAVVRRKDSALPQRSNHRVQRPFHLCLDHLVVVASARNFFSDWISCVRKRPSWKSAKLVTGDGALHQLFLRHIQVSHLSAPPASSCRRCTRP